MECDLRALSMTHARTQTEGVLKKWRLVGWLVVRTMSGKAEPVHCTHAGLDILLAGLAKRCQDESRMTLGTLDPVLDRQALGRFRFTIFPTNRQTIGMLDEAWPKHMVLHSGKVKSSHEMPQTSLQKSSFSASPQSSPLQMTPLPWFEFSRPRGHCVRI